MRRELLARAAEADAKMRGLLVETTQGDRRRNPLVKIAADAADDMIKYAGNFGLSPSRAAASRPACVVSHRAAASSRA